MDVEWYSRTVSLGIKSIDLRIWNGMIDKLFKLKSLGNQKKQWHGVGCNGWKGMIDKLFKLKSLGNQK